MLTSEKDHLFLLPGAFPDPALGPGRFHCTECARIEGILNYFPSLRERLDVTYVDHPRPRSRLVELLGEPYQNCPTIVVAAVPASAVNLLQISPVTGRAYCTGVGPVTAYLATVYAVSAPHP